MKKLTLTNKKTKPLISSKIYNNQNHQPQEKVKMQNQDTKVNLDTKVKVKAQAQTVKIPDQISIFKIKLKWQLICFDKVTLN